MVSVLKKIRICILVIMLCATNAYAHIDTRNLAIVGNSHAFLTSIATKIDVESRTVPGGLPELQVKDLIAAGIVESGAVPGGLLVPKNSIGGGKLDESDVFNENIYNFINVADRYERAVIYLGTNELNYSEDEFYNKYVEYLNRIYNKNPNLKIILISVPIKNQMNLPEQKIRRWNDIIEAIASIYDNVEMYKIDENDEVLSDVVHLTNEAYKKILNKALDEWGTIVIYQGNEPIQNNVGPGFQ
ncbi:MAG: hypothetical protein IJ593_01805 [Lachnospiraceae bacterium]|nr:hypothetical protein [Lachnospiraceae bacterium]